MLLAKIQKRPDWIFLDIIGIRWESMGKIWARQGCFWDERQIGLIRMIFHAVVTQTSHIGVPDAHQKGYDKQVAYGA